MCRKKLMPQGKLVLLLLIGIFSLSGCGQGNSPLTETIDASPTEREDTAREDAADNEAFTGTEEKAEEDENNESPEVPVNTQEELVPYYMEDGIDPLRALHRCIADGENIYLVYGEPDLYFLPLGADGHNCADMDNPEGLDVCNIAMDSQGRIHLLMADSDGDEWWIWRLDENRQIDKVMEISAYFETKQMPFWFLIDKDGTYYLQWVMNREGIIIDSEGTLKNRFTLESLGTRWTYEAAVGKDGLIYLVYRDGEEIIEIGEFDVESCSIKRDASSLCFPAGDDTFSLMSGGTDTNLLLYSPYSGVWACDTETGVLENRVPLSDIGFGSNMEFWPLTFLPDGRLVLLGRNEEEEYFKYLPAGK